MIKKIEMMGGLFHDDLEFSHGRAAVRFRRHGDDVGSGLTVPMLDVGKRLIVLADRAVPILQTDWTRVSALRPTPKM
jgi:hypothetical protein